jgi:hypothetical protein
LDIDVDEAVTAVQAVLSVIKDMYGIKRAYLVPEFWEEDGMITARVALVLQDVESLKPGDVIDLMRTLGNIRSESGKTICLLPHLYDSARRVEPDLMRHSVALVLRDPGFPDSI